MTGKIIIAGLGPGAAGHITKETFDAFAAADEVLLRTAIHPSVDELIAEGISFSSCDEYYNKEDFASVYAAIADTCLAKAQGKNIVYAVPGSPMVAERTVEILREKAPSAGIEMSFLPAISFLDVVFTELAVDPSVGLAVVDALSGAPLPGCWLPLIVTQVYSTQVASDLKLNLMEKYPDEHEVVFLRNLGMSDQEIRRIPLFELDRQKHIDHLTSLYVPPLAEGEMDITPLVETMATLRATDGCPWDREQDHKTLRRYLVEEVYEVIEAIENNDVPELCGELGDLLLQVVFHARIAEERGLFTMQQVVDGIVEKMHRRHPHVFGTVKVGGSAEVLANWEEIKKEEYHGKRKTVLDGVSKGLPALMRSFKLQSKAAKVGFDWPDTTGVWEKIYEEIAELKEALVESDQAAIEHELGDILFALANLARHIGCEPEVALTAANNRFSRRFALVEEYVTCSGKKWQDFSLAELETFWQQAKKSG